MALAFLVGFLIGYFCRALKKQKYDGSLIIGTVEDRDRFEFIFSTELEDLAKKPELVMKIEHSQNQQAV